MAGEAAAQVEVARSPLRARACRCDLLFCPEVQRTDLRVCCVCVPPSDRKRVRVAHFIFFGERRRSGRQHNDRPTPSPKCTGVCDACDATRCARVRTRFSRISRSGTSKAKKMSGLAGADGHTGSELAPQTPKKSPPAELVEPAERHVRCSRSKKSAISYRITKVINESNS